MILGIITGYMVLLLAIGIFSGRLFRGTSRDYFLASHSIGPFLLLMSVFGTTMTAFALVGSTGQAYKFGIGVYGKMASWSGLIHSLVFFLIGIKLWAFGKRYGYITQVQFFRDRFESNALGWLLFPILVLLVIPYLLIGLLGAESVMLGITKGMYPETFAATKGALPPWLTGLVISGVVLTYVSFGGLRSAVWANTFQTIVFMVTGLVAFYLISRELGGMVEASQKVLAEHPQSLHRAGAADTGKHAIGQLQFLTYLFIPLSVGMFPPLFQHWLTAKSAKAFRLTVIAHPICIMIVWVPCILIGVWATAAVMGGDLVVPLKHPPNTELAIMVRKLLDNPVLTGILTAGILAAIMSSLDSQFFCLSSMFTNDVLIHSYGKDRFTERQTIWIARAFVVLIIVVTYVLSLVAFAHKKQVFPMAVWCFSGFASLFPLVFAAVYWRRVTKHGAMASIIATFVTWLIFFVLAGGGEYLVWGMMPVAFIFAASLLALVVVSLLTQPPSEKTIDKFFPKAKATGAG